MEFETTKCIVLNSTYEPISIVPSKRALVLVLEGKAVVVEEHPHLVVRSPKHTFRVPTTVALKMFIRDRAIFKTKAALTQNNLFARDNHTCQYCNRHKSELHVSEKLTRDHIVPECKGGASTWENLVTACSTCNGRKANFYLNQVNMTVLKTPTAPTIFELWMRRTQKKLAK